MFCSIPFPRHHATFRVKNSRNLSLYLWLKKNPQYDTQVGSEFLSPAYFAMLQLPMYKAPKSLNIAFHLLSCTVYVTQVNSSLYIVVCIYLLCTRIYIKGVQA